jgi:hypothetical protein
LIFKLIEGEFAKDDCHVEVVMDDHLFPAYSSGKIKKRNHTFNETSDAVVREIEFSKITLRLVEDADRKGDNDQDNILGKLTGNTLDTLRQCLYRPTQLTFKDKDGRENRITVSLKYLPIKMQLDPSESINNQGNLRVDVLDATELPAADRNGFSDPYCKFILNGKEIYKTKTQKKTLHPAWNEFFEVPVRSRTAADFQVQVFDWDFGDKADKLGKAAINLEVLDPFEAQEVTLGLDGKSGSIRLRMLFKPDYITRTRQGSSTFSGTFAAPGKVIGAPVKGVGKGAVLVGGGVARSATFLSRGFRRRKSHVEEDPTSTPPPGSSAGEPNGSAESSPGMLRADGHQRHRSLGAQSVSSAQGAVPSVESGSVSISLLQADGYPAGSKVQATIRVEHNSAQPKMVGKEIHKTKAIKANESGSVTWPNESEAVKIPYCSADAQFRILVKDHSTFGSDDDLGEALFFPDDQGNASGEKTVTAGEGSVVLRAKFLPEEQASVSTNKLRRSFVGRRDRSVTPGT